MTTPSIPSAIPPAPRVINNTASTPTTSLNQTPTLPPPIAASLSTITTTQGVTVISRSEIPSKKKKNRNQKKKTTTAAEKEKEEGNTSIIASSSTLPPAQKISSVEPKVKREEVIAGKGLGRVINHKSKGKGKAKLVVGGGAAGINNTTIRESSDFARRTSELEIKTTSSESDRDLTVPPPIRIYLPPGRLEVASPSATSITSPPIAKRKKKKNKGDTTTTEGEKSSVDESGALLAQLRLEGQDLSEGIQKLYETQKATPAALLARQKLIEILGDMLNSPSSQHGYSSTTSEPLIIEAFGSVRFGLATSTSDLDLCLFDPSRPNGYHDTYFRTGRGREVLLPEIYDMRRLARRLKGAGFGKVTPVPFAGVPIVKFEARVDGQVIQADINTNERLGVLNSRLINAYCELHPSVRPLCVFIKFWAKQRKLNDPSGASGLTTYSSYTLILLVLSYLQKIHLLPNLQDEELIEASGTERTRFWTKVKKRNHKRRVGGNKGKFEGSKGWDTTFVSGVRESDIWEGKQEGEWRGMELKELARGFFSYYSGVEGEGGIDFTKEVVSIRCGGRFAREKMFKDPFAIDGGFRIRKTGGEKGREKGKGGGEILAAGEMSTREQARQEEEDDVLAALMESDVEEGRIELGRGSVEREVESEGEEMFDTREDSLEEGDGEFRQPANWDGKLIVQDPFLLERNTAGNILPDIVDALQIVRPPPFFPPLKQILTIFHPRNPPAPHKKKQEMCRALDLIDTGGTVSTICASIKNEPGYISLADIRRSERSKRNKINAKERERLERELLEEERVTEREREAVGQAMEERKEMKDVS